MTVPLSLLVVHFVADFLFQTDWMALNKSKNNDALALHAFVYAACFAWLGMPFAGITFITHFFTDYWTSRLTSKLWFFAQNDFPNANEWHYVSGRRHWFFVAIGADQLIHYVTLALTYKWLIGG